MKNIRSTAKLKSKNLEAMKEIHYSKLGGVYSFGTSIAIRRVMFSGVILSRQKKLPARKSCQQEKVAGETQKWPASLEWKFRALTQAVFIARSPGLALFSS